MDNLTDIQSLWLSAPTDSLPDSQEMLNFVKKFRNQRILRKIFTITVALLMAAVMLFMLIEFRSTLLSTKLGEILIITGALVLAVSNIRSMKRFHELKDCSNKEFIDFMEQTRLNQIHFFRKTQVIAMLLFSTGLLLYTYELIYKDLFWLISIYSFAVLYLAFIWFFLRPRIFRKESARISGTLEHLKKISNQINT